MKNHGLANPNSLLNYRIPQQIVLFTGAKHFLYFLEEPLSMVFCNFLCAVMKMMLDYFIPAVVTRSLSQILLTLLEIGG